MCGKGSQQTTQQSQQTNTPNPQAMGVYSNILNQAAGVANTPYQGYGGELVAGINPQQMGGIQNINAAQHWFPQATNMAYQAAQGISPQDIQQYMSPYTQDVINATQNQFANMNAQQQQQVLGNAVAQGALGGNRTGIAQSQLANQQQLAQAPVISGLYNQGYSQALNTALAEQQAKLQGAYGVGNLGQAQLSGANAQIGAGTLQQQTQQQQDVANYQQYLNQMAYPFQTTQWLAGIGTGVGSQMGGTTTGNQTTTAPAPSWLGQLAGGALGLGALYGGAGGFRPSAPTAAPTAASGGRINGVAGYQAGGGIAGVPYAGSSEFFPDKWRPTSFVPGVGGMSPSKVGGGDPLHYLQPHREEKQQGSSTGMKGIMDAYKAATREPTAAEDAKQDRLQDIEDEKTANAWPESADLEQVGPGATDVTGVVPETVTPVADAAASEAATGTGSLASAYGLETGTGVADAGLGAGTGALSEAGAGAGAGSLFDAGLGAAGGDALAGLGGAAEGVGAGLGEAVGAGGEALAGLGGEALAGLGAASMEEILPWLGMLLLNRGGRVNGVSGYQSGGGLADDPDLLSPELLSGADADDPRVPRFERAAPQSLASLREATGVSPGSEYSPLSSKSIADASPEGFQKTIPASEVPMPRPAVRPAEEPATAAPAVAAAEPAGVTPKVASAAGVVPAAAAPAPAPVRRESVSLPRNVPRGIRNNNPGNIEDGPFTRKQPGYMGGDGRFAIFKTPEDGQAATQALLKSRSYAGGGLNTITGIISRWAPASDGNDTREYIRKVSEQTGLNPNEPLDVNNPTVMKKVADAMHSHENGMPSDYINRLAAQNYNRAYGADLPPLARPSVGIAPGRAGAKESGGWSWGADNPAWLPLAAAGFQMASSASRPGATFAGSLGEGGLTGVQSYASQLAHRDKLAQLKEDRALKAQHLQDQASKWNKDYLLRQGTAAETERYHKEHADILRENANKPMIVDQPNEFGPNKRIALRDPAARFKWRWADTGKELGVNEVGADGVPISGKPATAGSKLPWWAQNVTLPGAQPPGSFAGGFQAGGAPQLDDSADAGGAGPPMQIADAGPAAAGVAAPVRVAEAKLPPVVEEPPPASPVRVAEAASPPPMVGEAVPFRPPASSYEPPEESYRSAAPEDPERPFKNVTPSIDTVRKAREMGLTGQAMLDAIPLNLRSSVEAMANYKGDASAYSTAGRGGVQKSVIENLARAVNPAYDAPFYAMQKQAMKNFYAATTPQSPLVLARTGRTATGHAGDLAEAIHDLHTIDPANYEKNMGYVNSAVQSALHKAREAGVPFGSWFSAMGQKWMAPGTKGPVADALARIAATVPLYAGEVERFYTGAQGSETGRQQIQAPFDPSRSYAEHMAALHQQKNMFKSKTETLDQEFEAIMNAPGMKEYGTMKQYRDWHYDNERSKEAQELIDKLYIQAKGEVPPAERKVDPKAIPDDMRARAEKWLKDNPKHPAAPGVRKTLGR